jgi:hypothetical protein
MQKFKQIPPIGFGDDMQDMSSPFCVHFINSVKRKTQDDKKYILKICNFIYLFIFVFVRCLAVCPSGRIRHGRKMK